MGPSGGPPRPPVDQAGLAKRPSGRHIPGMPRQSFLFVLLLLATSAACERAATGPSIIEEDRVGAARGARNTLPALFTEALRTAQLRAGSAAVNAALQAWASRQAEVQAAYAAGDAAAVQANLHALRNEEIRLIIGVLGTEVVTRVLVESNGALADARQRIAEAAQLGAQTGVADAAVTEIEQLLARATTLAASQPQHALAIVTEAARLLETIDDTIIELRRLRGVESLFPEVVARLQPQALRRHARLQGDAQAALRGGDRAAARARLEAVRAEEIRLVLQATNERACEQLLGQIAASITELRHSLKGVESSDGDLLRLERMLATAHDLQQQARHAEAAGDHAKALDLGSHAAGLLNSMRHLLVK